MEAATLGYTDERVQLLNANHQNLVKFESTDDSNYRSLRNRLSSTIQQIRNEKLLPSPCENSQQHREHGTPSAPPPCPRPSFSGSELQLAPPCHDTHKLEQMETLRTYSGTDFSPEASLNDARLRGSCSWLPAKLSFQKWLCPPTPRYFWLKGAPASGKSTVASHVVEYLEDGGHPTCYYFFKAGETTTSNLGSFLCSMAYQVANTDSDVRDALVQLAQQGLALDFRNPKSLWRNLFSSCVLRQPLTRPHFWVIDALDEAAETGHADDYFLLLSKIDDGVPLKVFVTSRPDFALDTLFTQLPTITESVQPKDSLGDIRLYIDTWSLNLPDADAHERKRLVDDIVGMSGGNFLWTVLVMKNLGQVMTVEGIHQVLGEVPKKMSELYQHNIKRIEASRSKEVAKHIIMWTICAILPLTVDQIKDAIKMSLNITLVRDLRSTLQSMCGQFLDVDMQSRVQVIHETARAFLIDPNLESELRVDRPKGHSNIASACLEYLLGEGFHHSRRRRSRAETATSRTTMDDYVCLRWSEHLVRSSASSDRLLELLVKFFQTNVLSWIEWVVRLKDLDCLNRTSKHLSGFLGRRSMNSTLLSTEINAWTVDLPKIATQFGAILLNDPTSIHTFIPSFCPRNSAICKRFGSTRDGITLVGAWNTSWDERICSISYHKCDASKVSARDHLFAVSLNDRQIKVYQTSTFEERLALGSEFLDVLDFGHTAKFIASACPQYVNLWDTATGEQLFFVNTNTRTLALGFNETESQLIVASQDKYLTVFQIPEGTQLHRWPWRDTFLDTMDLGPVLGPAAVTLCTELRVMAVAYDYRPVQLWSLESHHCIGACIGWPASDATCVSCFAFNPAAAKPSLLVSWWRRGNYDDHLVVVYDVMTCKPLASMSTYMRNVAIAPNGKSFASSGERGIRIFDFETLQLLHRIPVNGGGPSSLVFTSDSLRIIGTKDTQVHIWEPPILVDRDSDSQCGERSESVHQIVEDVGSSPMEQPAAITSIHCCDESETALCGRQDGWVDICDLDNPEKTMRHLYQHREASEVTCIDWAYRAGIAVSTNSDGRIHVMKITRESRGEWRAEAVAEVSLERPWGFTQRIVQILVHPDGSHVLISSSDGDTLWSIATKQTVATIPTHTRTVPYQRKWRWFVQASAPSQLILVEYATLRFFNWTDLAEIPMAEAFDLPMPTKGDPAADYQIDTISISSDGNDLVYVQNMLHRPPSPEWATPRLYNAPKVHFLNLSPLSAGSAHARRRSCITGVANIPGMVSVIGTVNRLGSWFLVFIWREGWVCSLELGDGGTRTLDTFQKHFFIPAVWRFSTPYSASSLIAKVFRSQDIVFAHQNGVAVVKNGLDDGQRISFSQS